MSRTIRRGRPSRNLHHYKSICVLKSEHSRIFFYYGGSSLYWEFDSRGLTKDFKYSDYVQMNIRNYHRDKSNFGNCRYARIADVKNQSRAHKRAIMRAMKSGDFDISLDALSKINTFMVS